MTGKTTTTVAQKSASALGKAKTVKPPSAPTQLIQNQGNSKDPKENVSRLHITHNNAGISCL
jgi:hypothetical protein